MCAGTGNVWVVEKPWTTRLGWKNVQQGRKRSAIKQRIFFRAGQHLDKLEGDKWSDLGHLSELTFDASTGKKKIKHSTMIIGNLAEVACGGKRTNLVYFTDINGNLFKKYGTDSFN